MSISREVRQESSVPVQSRVSVVDLAEMFLFWREQGHYIRSMSQLVSWTVELMVDVLRENEKLIADISSVTEAHQILEASGLYQKSMRGRAYKKIGMALAFENLRNEGVDPRTYGHMKKGKDRSMQYNIMHNEKSVNPLFKDRVNSRVTPEMIEIYEKLEKGENIGHVDVKEKMSEEEIIAKDREIEKRDREYAEQLKNVNLNDVETREENGDE